MMFDDNVYPIISSKTAASGCAMAGCHMVGNTPGLDPVRRCHRGGRVRDGDELPGARR